MLQKISWQSTVQTQRLRWALCDLSFHPQADHHEQLAAFHIGTLDATSVSTAAKQAVNMDSAVFLDAKQWKPVKLIDIKKVSPDTRVYRFELTRDDQPFGLPTG